MRTLTLGFHALLIAVAAGHADRTRAEPPIPVIYDTDLGEDIDDTWALCFLLNSPELDLKREVRLYGHRSKSLWNGLHGRRM
jgi:hypothetical protein